MKVSKRKGVYLARAELAENHAQKLLKFGTLLVTPDGEIPAQLLSDGSVIATNKETKTKHILDVSEGYVRARGEAISQIVQDRLSGSNQHGLVVPFAKERDWLREIAPEALPEQRLSLHDFIALFFGDYTVSAATAAIRELRPNLLKAGERNAWIESVQDGFGGGVACYVASSRKRDDDRETMGYMMARRKAEPFGIVSMEANIRSLRANCAITVSGPAPVDPNPSSFPIMRGQRA